MAIRSDFSINFDVSPRIITVASPSIEVTVQDLHDTCRSLESDATAMDNPSLISSSGLEQLGGGVKVGLTATLQNTLLAFEARSGPSYTQCSVSGGNVIAIDDIGAVFTTPISPTAFTQVVVTASSSATLQNQKQLEAGLFNGVIAIDTVNGISGTGYDSEGTPIGTHEVPSNNMTDSLTIAQARGLEVFVVHNSLTLITGDNVAGYVFRGENASNTFLIIEAGADVSNCQFEDMIIDSSVLDGFAYTKNCSISDVIGVGGYIENSMLSYNIQLSGIQNKFFVDCKSGCVGLSVEVPVIDFNNAEHHVAMRNWAGPIKLKNSNNAAATACIDIGSGATIIIEPTITEGEFIIRGSGRIVHIQTGNETIIDETTPKLVWEDENALNVETYIGLS